MERLKYDNLYKYFESVPIGYGDVKLNDVRKELENIAKDKQNSGLNDYEIIEELIDYTKSVISNYESKLNNFNSIVKNLEEKRT